MSGGDRTGEWLGFVVGARRSGTTWLQRILEAHPHVAVVPAETYLFSHGVAAVAERVQHGSPGLARTGFAYAERAELIEGLRAMCDRILRPRLDAAPGARLLVERTPWHARHLPLIHEIYPAARLLHIVRDGRDVAASLRDQAWGPDSLADAAGEWVDTVQPARAAAAAGVPVTELRYEQLLADPAAGAEQIYRGLGLDCSLERVHQGLAEAGVATNTLASSGAIAAEKWRSMAPDDLAEIEAVAGPLLSELGYPASAGGPTRPATRPGSSVAARARRAARQPRAVARRIAARRWSRDAERRANAHQQLADEFLRALHGPDPSAMVALLAADARVEIDLGTPWAGRGAPAHAHLADTLAADPALSASQLRATVSPGHPTFTIVTRYRLDGGGELLRTLVLTFGDGRVATVGWYGS
ncbi:MAG: sulfotransferase [Solirubrobacterales bacterium]